MIETKKQLPAYSHIKEIDDQHEELIRILNSFFEEMVVHGYKGEIVRMLTEVKGYANHHFATEEKYFEQYGYPKKNEHRSKHNEFRAQVKDFENRFTKHEPLFAFNLSNFLEEWFIEHITKDDKDYMDYYREQGFIK